MHLTSQFDMEPYPVVKYSFVKLVFQVYIFIQNLWVRVIVMGQKV